MAIKLSGGTKCLLSISGHRDFLYPCSDLKSKIKRETQAERLPWVGSQTHYPFRVLSKDVCGIDCDNKYVAVWIRKDLINKIINP